MTAILCPLHWCLLHDASYIYAPNFIMTPPSILCPHHWYATSINVMPSLSNFGLNTPYHGSIKFHPKTHESGASCVNAPSNHCIHSFIKSPTLKGGSWLLIFAYFVMFRSSLAIKNIASYIPNQLIFNCSTFLSSWPWYLQQLM